MNNYQIAQNTMHTAFKEYLQANASIYSTDVTFQNNVNTYLAKKDELQAIIEYLEADKAPYSKEKDALKRSLTNLIIDIAGYAKVGFIENKMSIEADQMNISSSYFLYQADTVCAERVGTIRNIINDHMSVLNPNYVTVADIATLDKALADYIGSKGTSETIHHNAPDKRKQLKECLRELDDLKDRVLLLSKRFRTSHPDFFMELDNAGSLGVINVRHTSIVVEVSNATDGTKVANAIVKINKSKKVATSDSVGKASLIQVSHGKAILTLTAPGFKVFTQEINIEQGKENQVQVVLTPAA